MRYILLTLWLTALIFCSEASAQLYGLAAAEYFVDTDPGQGLATALPATDGTFSDVWESVSATMAAQPAGLHTIGIRLKDANGNWGPVFRRSISVENLSSMRGISITMGEFFVGNDPGQGLGTPVLAFDGDFNQALETVQMGSVNLAQGVQRLNLRIRGADGAWSAVFSCVISVETLSSARDIRITTGEFFIDTDPGAGNGLPLAAFDGNFNDAFESVLLSNLTVSQGLHTLNIRLRGLDGNWGAVFSRAVVVENALAGREVNITAAEYFWDADPGAGAGSPLVVFDGNFDEALEQVMASAVGAPATGNHLLGIRVRGMNDGWSNVFTTVLAVEVALTARSVRVTASEFFWDTDPGAGQGTPMLAFDGNFNLAFEQASAGGVANPGVGPHVLNVRLLGANNTWSQPFSTTVVVENALTASDVRIAAGEYYFDADPGVGAGTPLVVLDGSYNEAFESASATTNSGLLTPGAHVLGVRFRSPGGSWSQPFQSVVYVDPCLTSPLVSTTPAGTVSICPEDSVLLTATSGLSAYQWYSGLNQVGNQQTLWVDSAAFYRVIGFDSEGCPGISPNVQVLELSVPANVVAASGPLSFCSGGGVVLTASSGFAAYQWSNGAVGQSITVTDTGNYSCVATTAGGCSRTSQTVAVDVYSAPPAPVITPATAVACVGETVELTADYVSGITWSTLETSQSIAVFPGMYSVTYTDTNGCSSSSAATVSLSDGINSIGLSASEVWLPASTISFTSNTSGTVVSYLWDFGDGNTSAGNDPAHTYTESGFYTVTLTVQDASGCTTQETWPGVVTVWEVFPTDDVSIPVNANIFGAVWLSPLIGYVTLLGGQLCYTTDGGQTWFPVVGCTAEDIQGITYTGDANGYCAYTYGNNGFVYESCNGAPFLPISPVGLTPGTNFYGGFWNGGTGYFFGSNNTICYYVNGNWFAINPSGISGSTTWYGGWFAGGYLWAYGSGGLICYYDFATGQWFPANGTVGGGGGSGGTGSGTTFNGGYYSVASTCEFVVGSGGVEWGSYDNGNTWQSIDTGYDYNWSDVIVVGSTIIVVGENGAVCVSHDGGISWTIYSIGTNHNCTGVSFSECIAYITTEEGGVFQFPVPSEPTFPLIDGLDTEICSNQVTTLFVEDPSIGSTYVWSNGSVSTSIVVNVEGLYTVTEFNACDTLGSNSKYIDVTPATTYYRDVDNDGYGNPFDIIQTCDPAPMGYISDNTDCNDADATMYPGAPGTNAYKDNDCNGVVEGDELGCIGDINNDEFVNTSDLLILMGLFGAGCGSPYCQGDFTGDGVVNVTDLLLFMGYFGQLCP